MMTITAFGFWLIVICTGICGLCVGYIIGYERMRSIVSALRKAATSTLEDECAHQAEKLRGWADPDEGKVVQPSPEMEAIWRARKAEKEIARARFIGEKPPRDTGHLGTPMDRIPLRKPSRGNGHETPYARKKRAAKPKGKA